MDRNTQQDFSIPISGVSNVNTPEPSEKYNFRWVNSYRGLFIRSRIVFDLTPLNAAHNRGSRVTHYARSVKHER